MKVFGFIFRRFHSELRALQKNRELRTLQKTPRYKKTTTNLLGRSFVLADSASFLTMYHAIFEQQIYRFKTEKEDPLIIDCGANIGLSTLYFRKNYPKANIIAFEPDDKIFHILRINMQTFGYTDIKLINKALWTSETKLKFYHEGADAGRIARNSDTERLTTVPVTRLRNYLNRSVDLLKIDIEGAETDVLKDCEDLLCNIENLFVEYHSFLREPQTLHTLISILSKAGFRLHIHSQNNSRQPFCACHHYMGIDMLLNIFAFR